MKARQPDRTGYAVNAGVRLYYEVHGDGPTTLLFVPTWSIIDSQCWKMQVPYLSRHFRVITYDPRGNGRSDRPQEPAAYADEAMASDIEAVMDAADVPDAFFVSYCYGMKPSLVFAESHPSRVRGLVAISTEVPSIGEVSERDADFEAELDSHDGWAKSNRHYWNNNWSGYVEFFFSQVASDPHSTKLVDDLVGWGLQTDAPTILCTVDTPSRLDDVDEAEAILGNLRCPVLAITGDDDHIVPTERTSRLAELTDAELLVIKGGGHSVQARYPVVVNRAIRAFVDRVAPPPARAVAWSPALSRKRRALWISSPIGLGHVLRDVAIARQLRERVPDLEIEWLAQPPVTDVLRQSGELIHPASDQLSSESAHWESEATSHDLHAFYAFRRMDEILLANYMLFDDVTSETPYDIWIGDECWEVDHFLHENPDRKTAPYVFTTDVVGFLPVNPEGDPREVDLCADYNAEMIEHRARFPHVRDLSLFIGGYDELPDASLGPGLPDVRSWTRDWFESVPYVLPFNPADYRDTAALRSRLHLDGDGPLLVAAVGGTSVGADLLEPDCGGFPLPAQGDPGRPDADGHRAPDRSARHPRRRGDDQARLRARPVRAPGGVRHRHRAGWSEHDHGAGRCGAPVHLLLVAEPLGAAALRAPPPQPLRGRHPDGVRRHQPDRPRGRDERRALVAAALPTGLDRRRPAGRGSDRPAAGALVHHVRQRLTGREPAQLRADERVGARPER